ncbi:hypothetical protein FB45DRAFT_873760 [Roridomyces roridus]|uniref:Uncharacterized protein n=1 Tax=Roridomyces roridus TaxID=1738132 RepID=A0AAD7FC36_9AGAR|nr:hypothetical protein FB45DRAFT_873760 [Roridomyces roridus]
MTGRVRTSVPTGTSARFSTPVLSLTPSINNAAILVFKPHRRRAQLQQVRHVEDTRVAISRVMGLLYFNGYSSLLVSELQVMTSLRIQDIGSDSWHRVKCNIQSMPWEDKTLDQGTQLVFLDIYGLLQEDTALKDANHRQALISALYDFYVLDSRKVNFENVLNVFRSHYPPQSPADETTKECYEMTCNLLANRSAARLICLCVWRGPFHPPFGLRARFVNVYRRLGQGLPKYPGQFLGNALRVADSLGLTTFAHLDTASGSPELSDQHSDSEASSSADSQETIRPNNWSTMEG